MFPCWASRYLGESRIPTMLSRQCSCPRVHDMLRPNSSSPNQTLLMLMTSELDRSSAEWLSRADRWNLNHTPSIMELYIHVGVISYFDLCCHSYFYYRLCLLCYASVVSCFVSCYVMSCYVTSCYVMLCVMFWRLNSCHVMYIS